MYRNKRKRLAEEFVERRYNPEHISEHIPELEKIFVFNEAHIANHISNIDDVASCLGEINETVPSSVFHHTDDPNNFDEICNTERQIIAKWACDTRQTRVATNSLLSVLGKHNCDLPKDYRSLCYTPRKTDIQTIDNGSYIHIGIKRCIEQFLQKKQTPISNEILIDLNIDGVPVAIKSIFSLWPILVSIADTTDVYVVGVFYAKGKPTNINSYMKQFVDEFLFLQNNGCEIDDKRYCIAIRCIICDAPARAFLLDIKGHTGFCSCHKCEVIGKEILNRIVFPGIKHRLRTDRNFRNRTASSFHRNREQILELQRILTLDLVKQVPVDYMHAALLGMMKQLLISWIKERLRSSSMKKNNIRKLSDAIQTISNQFPKEYQHRIDDLKHCKRFKATNFRKLLCILPIALEVVGTEWLDIHFVHFLKFSCAIRILCSSELCISQNTVAATLLQSFVVDFENKYGSHKLSFNMHSLLHLSDDVLFFQRPLDSFSAFKFENFLQILKKKSKTCFRVLEQISNRYIEMNTLNELFYNVPTKTCIPNNNGGCKSTLFNQYYVAVTEPDNHVCLNETKDIIKITKIVSVTDNLVIVNGNRLLNTTSDIFDKPIASKKLEMHKTEENLMYTEEYQLVLAEKSFKKMIKFHFNNSVYFISMLH